MIKNTFNTFQNQPINEIISNSFLNPIVFFNYITDKFKWYSAFLSYIVIAVFTIYGSNYVASEMVFNELVNYKDAKIFLGLISLSLIVLPFSIFMFSFYFHLIITKGTYHTGSLFSFYQYLIWNFVIFFIYLLAISFFISFLSILFTINFLNILFLLPIITGIILTFYSIQKNYSITKKETFIVCFVGTLLYILMLTGMYYLAQMTIN